LLWDQILSDMQSDETAADSFNPRRRINATMVSAKQPRRQQMNIKEKQLTERMFSELFHSSESAPATLPVQNKTPFPDRDGLRASTLLRIINSARKSERIKHGEQNRLQYDSMSEAIDYAMSNSELLTWAEREVFAVSVQYANSANAAIDHALTQHRPIKNSADALPPLQAPAYADVVAKLIKTFREKWRDPHLALAIFNHARDLNTYSYALGCTVPVYNEVLETRWTCFRDLQGILNAAEEMKINSVRPDSRTQSLWERIRREIGISADVNASVHDIVGRIDHLLIPRNDSRRRLSTSQALSSRKTSRAGALGRNQWRNLDARHAVGLSFDEWDARSAETG
jgi:hypothetical protein